VPPRFVAGFLLLGVTKKSMRCSMAFQTSHNKTVYAAPAVAGLASIRLGRLRLPRLIPAHFVGPGLCFAKPLYGLAKRRKQPERYAKWGLKFLLKYYE
jgi:hypothetical protein